MTMIYHFNRWDEALGSIHFIEAVHDETTDGDDSLEIVCTDDAVHKGDRLVWQDAGGRWREHIVDTVETTREDGAPVTRLSCVSALTDLSYIFEQQASIEFNGVRITLSQMLTKLLSYEVDPSSSTTSRWRIGTVEDMDVPQIEPKVFMYTNARAVIQEIIDNSTRSDGSQLELYPTIEVNVGGVTTRRVNLHYGQGNQDALWRFEYGLNADRVTRRVDQHTVTSRLYVYGATKDEIPESEGAYTRVNISGRNQGREYIESDASLEQWGLPGGVIDGHIEPTSAVAINDEMEDDGWLWAWGVREWYRRRNLRVSYDVDASELYPGDAAYSCALGDSVQIVDNGLRPAARVEGRIHGVRRDLVTGKLDLTIGNVSKALSYKLIEQRKAIDSISRRVSKIEAASNGGA